MLVKQKTNHKPLTWYSRYMNDIVVTDSGILNGKWGIFQDLANHVRFYVWKLPSRTVFGYASSGDLAQI